MTIRTPLPLLGVLATLAICPNRQTVQAVVDLCFDCAYSDEDWSQIQAAAERRLRKMTRA